MASELTLCWKEEATTLKVCLKLELLEEMHLKFFDWFGLIEKQLLELKEKQYQVSMYGR